MIKYILKEQKNNNESVLMSKNILLKKLRSFIEVEESIKTLLFRDSSIDAL